jgi:hypothetical protein
LYRPKRRAVRAFEEKGECAVVLWCSMNWSGVIWVQIVSTSRFAHRHKFERTRVPLTVMARIKELAGEIGLIVLKDDAMSINDLVCDSVVPSDSLWGLSLC